MGWGGLWIGLRGMKGEGGLEEHGEGRGRSRAGPGRAGPGRAVRRESRRFPPSLRPAPHSGAAPASAVHAVGFRRARL